MCRWMAWLGQPVLVEELLFKTQHGIVDQSLHARMGAEPTNGDGFGLGWYGVGEGPGVYRSIAPAWADANLREFAAHIESPLFLAHIRAAIGSPVQQTNCHPFRHGRWLFVHNGYIADLQPPAARPHARRRAERFAAVEGSTDTEVVFHLALTFGLEEDPIPRSSRRSGSSRRPRGGTESTTPYRRPSAYRTAPSCGRCATRARGRRGRCSRRVTSMPSGACIPRTSVSAPEP